MILFTPSENCFNQSSRSHAELLLRISSEFTGGVVTKLRYMTAWQVYGSCVAKIRSTRDKPALEPQQEDQSPVQPGPDAPPSNDTQKPAEPTPQP
jgi:hypothetical protein